MWRRLACLSFALGCQGSSPGSDPGGVEIEFRNSETAVTIVVHDGEGTPVVTTATDAHGHAFVELPDGGMITVYDPAEHGGIRLRTFTGLAGGEHLVVNDGTRATSSMGPGA